MFDSAFKWLMALSILVDECYLAVKFDDEEIQMFGKVCSILELNISFVVFNILLLETVGFNDSLIEHMQYAPKHLGLFQWHQKCCLHIPAPLHVYSFNSSDYIKLENSPKKARALIG